MMTNTSHSRSHNPLIAGIVRNGKPYQASQAEREMLDMELNAQRKDVHTRNNYRCVHCNYESAQYLEISHKDGNHANNHSDNLESVDDLCHATQHLGQNQANEATMLSSDGLRAPTLLAAIPEISQTDINLLQRVLGAALTDESEHEIAKEIFMALKQRTENTRLAFAHNDGSSFSQALARLTPEEYAKRHQFMGDLRVLFRPKELLDVGRKMLQEHSTLPISSWAQVFQSAKISK